MENVLTQAKAAANRKETNRDERTRNVFSPRSAQLQIRNALNAENSENVFTQSLRWWFIYFLAEPLFLSRTIKCSIRTCLASDLMFGKLSLPWLSKNYPLSLLCCQSRHYGGASRLLEIDCEHRLTVNIWLVGPGDRALLHRVETISLYVERRD